MTQVRAVILAHGAQKRGFGGHGLENDALGFDMGRFDRMAGVRGGGDKCGFERLTTMHVA